MSSYSKEADIEKAVAVFTEEYFNCTRVRKMAREWRYDLGESTRIAILDMDKCICKGWESSVPERKQEYYEEAAGLLLPGDRMVHNFKWKITIAISKAEAYPNYIYFTKEHFAGVLCSYLGLLKHTASYNLRKEQMARLQHSKWDAVLDFDTENYLKVSVKPAYTTLAYAVRQNKKRKQQLKAYYYELTGNPETN